MERKRILKASSIVVSFLIVIILITWAFKSMSNGSSDMDEITLYGFSVKGEIFETRIIPDFIENWKETTGKEIRINTMFAGSGKITNQVIGGAPAEVMILSTGWDVLQLMDHGLVKKDPGYLPNNGTFSMSPWVIVTREGNPHNINGFEDLADDDIEIVHADPRTSGGACWSIFAIYGNNASLLGDIMDNVISWQSSARKALSQFTLGYGDAIITYENEALLAKEKGESIEIIYPNRTIMSEHKAVVVDANVEIEEREMIDAFLEYLFSEEVQRSLPDYGFRSPSYSCELPEIDDPFTVDELGGWRIAHEEIIDGIFTELRGS